MPGFRELLSQTKSEIREIDPAAAESQLGSATFLDVREQSTHKARRTDVRCGGMP